MKKIFKKTNIFKKKNLKLGIYIVTSFIVVFFIAYILLFLNFVSQTKNLPNSTNLSQDLESWARQSELLGVFPETDNKSFRDVLIMRVLDTYIKNYSKFNERSIIDLPKVEFFEYSEKQILDPEMKSQSDDRFFNEEKYRFSSGEVTFSRNAIFKLKVDDKESSQIEVELTKTLLEEYNNEVVGTLNNDKVIELIKGSFNNLINAIKKNDSENAKQYIEDSNIDSAIKQVMSINNISEKAASLYSVRFDLQIIEKDKLLSVGKLTIEQKGSTFVNSLDVIYDRTQKNYKFADLFDSFSQIPNPGQTVQITVTPNQVKTINCTDCFLAPVDKFHSLPSTYAPSVINVSLPGGGQLTSSTISALNDLNNDASSKGIDIKIISAYRAYQTQVATFNFWVGEQKKKGLSQEDAEFQANKVSARPGHSEHQLGTAVDLKCASCGNFDNSPKNLALYQFIEQNAHKFGFVISYPKGKEALTGYNYEPWHIRFIGIELATEFFNMNYISEPGLSSTILLSQKQ